MGLFPFQGITKSSLGLGSIVREKAKNRVKTKKWASKASRGVDWRRGKGDRAWKHATGAAIP